MVQKTHSAGEGIIFFFLFSSSITWPTCTPRWCGPPALLQQSMPTACIIQIDCCRHCRHSQQLWGGGAGVPACCWGIIWTATSLNTKEAVALIGAELHEWTAANRRSSWMPLRKEEEIKNVFLGVEVQNAAGCLTGTRMIPTQAVRLRSCLPAQTLQCGVWAATTAAKAIMVTELEQIGMMWVSYGFRNLPQPMLVEVHFHSNRISWCFSCPWGCSCSHGVIHGKVFIFAGALANNEMAILEAEPRPTTAWRAALLFFFAWRQGNCNLSLTFQSIRQRRPVPHFSGEKVSAISLDRLTPAASPGLSQFGWV